LFLIIIHSYKTTNVCYYDVCIFIFIGSDIDAQTVAEISANWEVEDGESGLQLCEWAIGKCDNRSAGPS
jgi:hypothetical protein